MSKRLSLIKSKLNPTDIKIMLLATFVITVFSTGFYSVLLVLSSIDFRSDAASTSPTSIPWIDNQVDCNHTGRTWSNEKCWDYEHDSSF
jgi:hypothetical protein